MSRTLLLWDIDGTLLTGGHGMRALLRAGQALFGESFSVTGLDVAGKLDPIIFAEVRAKNGVGDQHETVLREKYLEQLGEELVRSRSMLRLAPGILDALAVVRERAAGRGDVVQGLLTGNFQAAASLKLSAAGIDTSWFHVNAFGEDGDKRSDLVLRAKVRFEALFGFACETKRVIVIGDTPRDVECARAHGCIAFGVATGRFGVEALREAGADHVVADLRDPAPLFQLLPGTD